MTWYNSTLFLPNFVEQNVQKYVWKLYMKDYYSLNSNNTSYGTTITRPKCFIFFVNNIYCKY